MEIKAGQKIRLIDFYHNNDVVVIGEYGIVTYDEDQLEKDDDLYVVDDVETKKYKDVNDVEHDALTFPGIGDDECYDPDEEITVYHLHIANQDRENDCYIDVIEAESWM